MASRPTIQATISATDETGTCHASSLGNGPRVTIAAVWNETKPIGVSTCWPGLTSIVVVQLISRHQRMPTSDVSTQNPYIAELEPFAFRRGGHWEVFLQRRSHQRQLPLVRQLLAAMERRKTMMLMARYHHHCGECEPKSSSHKLNCFAEHFADRAPLNFRISGNPEEYPTFSGRTNRKTDGEGFEPPVRLPVQQFSRLPP